MIVSRVQLVQQLNDWVEIIYKNDIHFYFKFNGRRDTKSFSNTIRLKCSKSSNKWPIWEMTLFGDAKRQRHRCTQKRFLYGNIILMLANTFIILSLTIDFSLNINQTEEWFILYNSISDRKTIFRRWFENKSFTDLGNL
jgi:hypothetical protein